jgi:hypothetical protein
MAVSVRTALGHAAQSCESVRSAVGITRPASLSRLSRDYTADAVFDQPIVTADGVALGGHHTFTISRDGTYRWQGHVRATGFPSFDVSIVMILGYPILLPDGSSAGGQFVLADNGRVHGTNEPGDREFSWDQRGSNPLLASEWFGVRRGTFDRMVQHDTDLFGSVGDIVSFIGQAVALGVTFGAAGVAIVVAGKAAELLDVEQLVLPGMVGVIFAAGAAFVFGPVAMFPAFVVGAVTSAALIKQRALNSDERTFADRVFLGRIDFNPVLLTNLTGFGGRPFTAPGPGGTILVNMGEGFDNPMTYTGAGDERVGIRAPGQLLIHELTHAWQIQNESFTPEYYCRALGTAIGTTGGDMSAYNYGPAGATWSSYGTEQQASIVDEWFAGNLFPMGVRPVQNQIRFEPMSDDPPNPYFRYIRDNIRTGIS